MTIEEEVNYYVQELTLYKFSVGPTGPGTEDFRTTYSYYEPEAVITLIRKIITDKRV